MIKIGVVGFGYWGPNIARNFNSAPGAQVCVICDIDKKSRMRAKALYPNIEIVSDYDEVLKSKTIDVVAIVTPVFSHFELAKEALKNGKHIFVEKPFTSTVAQAEELIKLAERRHLKIMVDHTFIFTGAVRKIKELIDKNSLGRLYYYDSTRVNLGFFQHDVNVIWDLAVHDLYIMDYLIKQKPVAVIAVGTEHFGRKLESVAYLTLYFKDDFIAHFNVNWLSPVKVRRTLIGGDKQMLVWDDLESDEKIKIYDKGVAIEAKEGIYNLLVEYRSGDMRAPRIDYTEALKVEAEYFLDCIKTDRTPINDGYAGLKTVKILKATDESLRNSNKIVKFKL